jgi:hypothetical protein
MFEVCKMHPREDKPTKPWYPGMGWNLQNTVISKWPGILAWIGNLGFKKINNTVKPKFSV